MIDIDKYNALKKRADKAKEDAVRAEGALEQQMKKLADEFGCESVQQAETMLSDLKKQEQESVEVYNQRMADFEEKWGKLL